MPGVTGLYRERLAAAEARQAVLLEAAWRQAGADGGDDVEVLRAAGRAAGPVVAAGQLGFIAEALAYLRALTAAALDAALSQVAPFAFPDGVAGWSAAGRPVGELTGLAPAVYLSRLAAGQAPGEALAGARSFLGAVAVSEPYRAANATVVASAVADERLTGRVVRVTEPGACAWCRMIADRGYVAHEAGGRPVTFAAHANCRCTASPEVDKRVAGRASIAYARRMRAGEAWARVPAPRLPV